MISRPLLDERLMREKYYNENLSNHADTFFVFFAPHTPIWAKGRRIGTVVGAGGLCPLGG